MTLKPLYMWAGGKTRLIKKYAPYFPEPSSFSTYVEPFFGGGAIFGSIAGKFQGDLVINDSNGYLMDIFRELRDGPKDLERDLRNVLKAVLAGQTKDDRKRVYYEQLESYWQTERPGELLALMKLGFNGIWQSNRKANGRFATPAGLLNQIDADAVVSKMDLNGWHHTLQATTIYSGDYSEVAFDPEGALVYLDPPYRDSFTTYDTDFGDREQKQVVEYAKSLAENGATVLFANRHVEGDRFFEELMPDAEFHSFDVTYTAGRRKRVENGFEAKRAREFLAILAPSARE